MISQRETKLERTTKDFDLAESRNYFYNFPNCYIVSSKLLDTTFSALNNLNKRITMAVTPTNVNTSSCNPKEPFVKLEDTGQASILNYNLPQSTCYRATNLIGLDILPEHFIRPPEIETETFWQLAEILTEVEWVERLKDEIELASKGTVFTNSDLMLRDGVRQRETNFTEIATSGETQAKTIAVQPQIAGVPIVNIAARIKKGFKPVLSQNVMGRIRLSYSPRPVEPKPEIVLLMNLKMCSYLGDYGAGRTVKTFSLLPGEKTTISIKTWEHNEESKKEASHVLDSLNESSANELQDIVETESSASSSTSNSTSKEFGGGMNISIPIKLIKIGGNFGGSKSNTFSSAMTSGVRNLTNSTSTQVSKADSLRQVEVNTETNSMSVSEREELTIRELENINKSRVLNFVFRQLLQEFFTITYLDDVQIAYVTGNAEDKIVTDLGGLEDFINEVIVEEARDEVKTAILRRLCNITDYLGTKHAFIECVEEDLSCDLNCECVPNMEPETQCYFRKREDLIQEYKGKSVKGVILDTTHRIIRTPAVVVEALLGQGEALDCYNQKLQDAAVENAILNNNALEQAIATIDGITDPTERATLYKKVFGDCCDVAQSGCGCNNGSV